MKARQPSGVPGGQGTLLAVYRDPCATCEAHTLYAIVYARNLVFAYAVTAAARSWGTSPPAGSTMTACAQAGRRCRAQFDGFIGCSIGRIWARVSARRKTAARGRQLMAGRVSSLRDRVADLRTGAVSRERHL